MLELNYGVPLLPNLMEFEWNESEPYRIGITIDDGTRFEKEIESAAPAL